MAGRPWVANEVADALALEWEEFTLRWPARSYDGWRYKKRMVATGKVKPRTYAPQLEESDPRALLAATIAMQRELGKLDRACNDLTVSIDTTEPIGVVFISDAHLGEMGTDMERLDQDVTTIAEHPRLYAYLGGDMAHNFILSVMAHFGTMDDSILSPLAQQELLQWFVERLEDSLIAIGTGNHDWWTKRQAGLDQTQDMAKRYNIVYTGHGGLVRLTVGQQKYRIYRRHKGRYNSSFNLTHMVKRMLEQEADFDVGVVEHGHVPAIEQFIRKGQRHIAVRTGSYLTKSAFAAEIGMTWEYGTPVVVFHPDQHQMTPFWSIEEAMAYLG